MALLRDDAQLATLVVVVFFILLALVTIIRVIVRREARWTKIRVGMFVERDMIDKPEDEGEEP